MPLIIELETMLKKRGKSSIDIVRLTGHTKANVSKFKNGKLRAVRLSTLHAFCEILDCQPGDIIKYVTEEQLADLNEQRASSGESIYPIDLGYKD